MRGQNAIFVQGIISFTISKDNGPAQNWRSGNARLELGKASCAGVILSDLQYRFSSFRGGDVDINHDDGNL